MLKIYKNSFDFDHCRFIEKLKNDNKKLLKPGQNDFTFRQIKFQIM